MADYTLLEALQALHQELISVREGHLDPVEVLNNEPLVQAFEHELQRFWSRPPKNEANRFKVQDGKIDIDGDEYSLNTYFRQATLAFADEINLDELEAARYMLESQEDTQVLGRSLLECAIIRFHQQRRYALDVVRILLELDSAGDTIGITGDGNDKQNGSEDEGFSLEPIQVYVAERIFTSPTTKGDGRQRMLSHFLPAMTDIKSWLQKLGDKIAAAQTLGQTGPGGLTEEAETIEFSRVSLIQQHELLGVIMCELVTKRQATVKDFEGFMEYLRKLDRYDHLLVHCIPAAGAYISMFGSPVGGHDLLQARQLHEKLFPFMNEIQWPLPNFQAGIRAWWLAQYSGFYLEEPPEGVLPANVNLNEEDRQRAKQFQDSVKEGAFDFLLSVAGDIKPPEWHDPVRTGMHVWLQRKCPPLAVDTIPFSDFFQASLVNQLEVFVDEFITNLPDVLRKLKVEEDEQRQLSQMHEQDLDLERFMLIVAYAYEGRQDAQGDFWEDPEGNLHGFLLWTSKRASTPLVIVFCEMLQAISGTDQWASAAHKFLLDDGHHSTGKMRRVQTLTWNQIFKELNFFLDKAKQKPSQQPSVRYRAGKPSHDIVETEPESAMMLESYLRLTTKLATESETARNFLLQHPSFNLVETILELASTPIPPRLRGCTFMTLKALLTRKTLHDSYAMWGCVDTWLNGGYVSQPSGGNARQPQSSPINSMERTFDEISRGFDDPVSFIQLLLALVSPAIDSSPLNDALPFPENCGSAFRVPGIEAYIDFVIGLVFASKTNDLTDVHQIRVLRLGCLDFILTCLATFNEDLIVMANSTNLMIDSIITTTDLATYVKMHPFARVMEWMLNDKVIAALFTTIHQEPMDVGNAAVDSPLILGIRRAVEVISKVLDLQTTYTNLVRPLLRQQSHLYQSNSKATYATFEDGLVTRLSLVVDLGNYVGIGHADLTLGCLKLLETMSASPKIAAVWSGSSRHQHRNKAIVAMEANGEHESISRAFISEMATPLDYGRESASPVYLTKIYILDFLLQCLRETPNKPTIAHLILGFKCGLDSLTVESNGAFDLRVSLFHTLLKLVVETPSGDANGMRRWLLALRARSIQVLHILWSSPLSSAIVVDELRENEFLFHLLVRETLILPDLPWEGQHAIDIAFPITDGSLTLIDFLTIRKLTLEYVTMELCMISQGRLPGIKRRIFEALNGQVTAGGTETVQIPTVFDLYDFRLDEGAWRVDLPPLTYYTKLDLSVCLETDPDGNSIYNIDRVQEILLLKRGESKHQGVVAIVDDVSPVVAEEGIILEFLTSTNRQKQLATQNLAVLTTWVRLLLVMVESNDFKGTAQTSFFLQTLQAILPNFEDCAADRPDEALELSKLAKVLLFKLHLATDAAKAKDKGKDKEPDSHAIGNLISDKLYQVFQICLQAIGKWAGESQLRAIYYEICYRYLASLDGAGPANQGRSKAMKNIQVHGERLINVICDDAIGGEPACQVAAFMLLTMMINIDQQEGKVHVVETLNKLNFIGVLVDSLRPIMQEWHEVFAAGNKDQENFQNARLALLLQLAQTRAGAKYTLHANLLRAVETSGLFSADPELQTSRDNPKALEQHYDLLAKVVRIIGAALVSRGSHNVVQGRRFLTDNRMLVAHSLKRSSGIGAGGANEQLEQNVSDLADGLMIIITATGFLDYENEVTGHEPKKNNGVLFH